MSHVAIPETAPAPPPREDFLRADRYRRQLETVANNANLALFIMDERQQCTYMNPAAEQLTGFSLPEVQGRPLHDVVHYLHPDGTPYPLEECPIDRAFPQNMREQGEEVFVHKDGHFYTVAFTASPILEEGRPVGTIIEARDVTREKEAEAERERLIASLRDTTGEREHLLEREREATRRSEFLAEASSLLGSTLAYEPTLAVVAGLALPFLGSWCFVDIVEADGTMRRVTVIHPDPKRQRLARHLVNGWPPERDDPMGAPRAVRTRRSEVIVHVPDEMLMQAAHGEENLRILRELGLGSLMVVPLIARDQVLGAITFVSAQSGHQYEDADLALAEDLASRAATAIDNARLFQSAELARVEAEEANRAKSLFLSTMSHELRTPLNAIAGYAELLQMEVKGPLLDEQRDQIARIQANQRHLLALVSTVLDFAKLEAGHLEIIPEDILLSELFDRVEPIVSPLAEKKGQTFPHAPPGMGSAGIRRP